MKHIGILSIAALAALNAQISLADDPAPAAPATQAQSSTDSDDYVPAGFEGYVYEDPRMFGHGGYMGTLIGPQAWGMTYKRVRITKIDMRPTTYKEDFDLLDHDQLKIDFSASTVLRVKPNSSKDVVERFSGPRWYDQFVRVNFRNFVQEAFANYNYQQATENREKIQQDVDTKLKAYLHNSPFEVMSVAVGNILPPKTVSDSVEAKIAAGQLLQQKDTQEQIAIKDAQIKIEEAKGIAKSQEIINASLTPLYIQHEAIQAQEKMVNSPNNTMVYIPVGNSGVPLVDSIQHPAHKPVPAPAPAK